MGEQVAFTMYAAAERADRETLEKQTGMFSEDTSLLSLMDAVPNIVLILNEERQLVYANKLYVK